MRLLIPAKARQRIIQKHPDGTKRKAYYNLRGEKIGYRIWDEEGRLFMECQMKSGLEHGRFRYFDENGIVQWEGSFVEGKQHGLAQQYDQNGKVIGKSYWSHGTGLDLWFHKDGGLSEERSIVDGCRNGYERWWNSDQRTVWSETHFKDNLEHGIHRMWNSMGTLKRGFPQYFIKGLKVTKREYIAAYQRDSSLPALDSSENAPMRKLPVGIAVKNGI